VRLVLRSDLCQIYCAIYLWMYSEFGVFGVFGVAVRFVRHWRGSRSQRIEIMSLRRNMSASLVEGLLTMDQRRGPKPACPNYYVDRTEYRRTSLMMRSFACNTNEVCHFCDSNLQPSTIAFCYYYCAEEAVTSHHVGRRRMMWLK